MANTPTLRASKHGRAGANAPSVRMLWKTSSSGPSRPRVAGLLLSSMPTAPRVFHPAGQLAGQDARRAYDAERQAATPTRKLYSTARWAKQRTAQLRDEPLCRTCAEAGRTTAATVCDHVEPHRGDVEAFWRGPFQSLCDAAPWRCHSRTKQAAERRPARASAAQP